MKTTLTAYVLAFSILTLSSIAAQAAGMLTDKERMTVYVFDKDKDGISSCYDKCAVMWPPYLGKEEDEIDEMMEGWTLVKRTDGTMQWAYQGKPLYYFKDDKNQGDMNGDGKGGVWHVVIED
jgi:predicted lipoprotein with Yx(FWY)xxD motif